MIPLTVGQEVRIHDVNDRKGAGPRVGHVVKVGRKLVTISTGPGKWQEQQFRIDEQRANDNYGHQWFRTMEQHDEDERRHAAWATLNEHGLERCLGIELPALETLEAIAALLQSAKVDA